MLLRSSSTPVLESLVVSCHSEPSPDIKHESLAGEGVLPMCVSFTSRSSSTSSPCITTCLTNFDPQSQAALGRCTPSTSLRKVFSEGDLFRFASSGSSSTPAQFAANSLLQPDNNAEGCPSSDLDLSFARSQHPPVKKGRASLPLSRWRSLGALPSELPSVYFDGGSAILEEGDAASPISSAAVDDNEERERRICIFDKLALPVGDMSNVIDVKQANDTTDAAVELNMLRDRGFSESTSDKTYVHGMGGEDPERGGLETNLSDHSTDAAFSGRQEPSYAIGQGTSLFDGDKGTEVYVPRGHDQTSQTKYVYHGDACEMVLGAGAGGRGPRPPTSVGERGRGGDSGGYGGRNSDPRELHYQSLLKDNPGHPLILQNYAQYLAEVKCDYQKAEEFYQRAILANPSDGELLGQYAKMLWEVQQDRKRAATYFERAVQAAPDNSYVMAAYASFLWSAEEEEEEEEEEHESDEEVKGSNLANVATSIYSLVSAGLL